MGGENRSGIFLSSSLEKFPYPDSRPIVLDGYPAPSFDSPRKALLYSPAHITKNRQEPVFCYVCGMGESNSRMRIGSAPFYH